MVIAHYYYSISSRQNSDKSLQPNDRIRPSRCSRARDPPLAKRAFAGGCKPRRDDGKRARLPMPLASNRSEVRRTLRRALRPHMGGRKYRPRGATVRRFLAGSRCRGFSAATLESRDSPLAALASMRKLVVFGFFVQFQAEPSVRRTAGPRPMGTRRASAGMRPAAPVRARQPKNRHP